MTELDLVTANPPYIASADIEKLSPDIARFEPRLALEGGSDGLTLVTRIIREAPTRLALGGVLALEVGEGQAPQARAALEAAGFEDIDTARDYARIERVVSGVWRRRK